CQKSLGMTYYYNHWDVSSYKAGTCLFSLHIKDADLEKAIYNALNVARKWEKEEQNSQAVTTA
ncbi:MAG: hypothetical protein V1753_11945, partial [Pseudomonadota bacterium]